MEKLEYDIVNVIQSIKKYYNIVTEHDTCNILDDVFSNKKPKHVVLMCLDGLGCSLLDKVPYLKSKNIRNINTVVPATTASATITLQTGLYPCEHGWVGWCQYFEEVDDIVELFSCMGYYNGKKYSVEQINGNIKFKHFYEDIKNSKVFFPDFIPGGSSTFEDLIGKVKNHINDNESSFSYVYWTQPDSMLHKNGCNDIEVNQILKDIDNLMSKLILEDTVVIVTADHGHIDVEHITLDDYPVIMECLKRLPSIGARFTSFFVKEGHHNIFLEETKQFEKYFEIFTKEEFINCDFFNKGKMHFMIDKFIGDYIFIAKDKYMIQIGREPLFKSAHAGITKEEMEVPLIIID